MTAPRTERIEDLETALQRMLQGHQASVWTAMPARITKVDLVKMTVECELTVQASITSPSRAEEWVVIPPLVDVPIVFPSGGGFMLTFPIAVGDECLVILASRCIDSWWQSGGTQIPQDFRMHDLSDGFALVGPRSQQRLVSGISTSDVVLRNEAGSTSVSIQASGDVAVVTPGTLTINASNVNITGDVATTGSLTNNGVNVGSTHQHSGVSTGIYNTGVPV